MNTEEKTIPEGQQTETLPPVEDKKPTKKEQLTKMLKESFDGYDPEDEEGSSDMLMGYIGKTNEQTKKLADALAKDPKLAQMLSDIVNGKRNASGALARYFGKDFLSAEEGTPEFEELTKAEEERKAEIEATDASKKEYDDNVEKSMPEVESFCSEKGYPVDEFLGKMWDRLIGPIFSGNYSREICELIDRAFNYDKDVADAMSAGEVKGRNTNIQKIKEERGDGLPKGIQDQGVASSQKKKQGNSLLEDALKA